MIEYIYTINKVESNILLKISCSQIELNLVMTEKESVNLIENINDANWNRRKSIKAGICLDSNIFWCMNDDKSISLLIGHDDETWEIALIIPLQIINELEKETGYNNVSNPLS